MRKQGGTPFWLDKYVSRAAISPPCDARGRFDGGHQSGLAGCKLPLLFKRGASSCSLQRQRQREPWGASPRLSAPTYLPTLRLRCTLQHQAEDAPGSASIRRQNRRRLRRTRLLRLREETMKQRSAGKMLETWRWMENRQVRVWINNCYP